MRLLIDILLILNIIVLKDFKFYFEDFIVKLKFIWEIVVFNM